MNIRHSALFIEKAETEFIPSELIKRIFIVAIVFWKLF